MMTTDKLKEMLRKLYGLPPYDTDSNIAKGDPYLAKYITDNFTNEQVKNAKEEIGLKRSS